MTETKAAVWDRISKRVTERIGPVLQMLESYHCCPECGEEFEEPNSGHLWQKHREIAHGVTPMTPEEYFENWMESCFRGQMIGDVLVVKRTLTVGHVYKYERKNYDDTDNPDYGEEWIEALTPDKEPCYAALLAIGEEDWPVHTLQDLDTGEEFTASAEEFLAPAKDVAAT